MELWLLGAGAIVLIVIAVYVVSRAPEASEATAAASPPRSDAPGSQQEETRMNERLRPELPPQGDQFEDQYTSATADLSAGGVATAREQLQATDLTAAGQGQGAAGLGSAASMPTLRQPTGTPRRVGMGAGASLMLAGGVGGVWLYGRWQRERNRPINRLRRGARAAALRFGERWPDADELADARPMSGLAAALLVITLLAARMRRGGSRAERARQRLRETADVAGQGTVVRLPDAEQVLERVRDALPLKIEVRPPTKVEMRPPKVDQRQARARMQRSIRKARSAQPAGVLPVGFGGLIAIAAAAYLVWRVFRGQRREERAWYIGEGVARE